MANAALVPRRHAARQGPRVDRRAPIIRWRRGLGNRLMRQGPWTGRYPAAAAMVIFALVPSLALSAALEPITPIIAKDLHMSLQAMCLASGIANAGYAVGTVLAVLLAQHLPQRRMLVLYAAVLVLGSVLAAAPPPAGFFFSRHGLRGS